MPPAADASYPGKPGHIFDRDAEWDDLARFATDQRPGATLGVVTGRRRQGKTLLLYELCRATGGFYFGATEATETESLRRLTRRLSEFLAPPVPIQLGDWEQAADALLALGRERPVTVVLDEFPYLVRASRALPSILQQALTPGREERSASRARILLCGSALSFMGGLLSGSAPLRGKVGLELPVTPLDYRLAARFWEIDDPRLAAKVLPIAGGTPMNASATSAGSRRSSHGALQVACSWWTRRSAGGEGWRARAALYQSVSTSNRSKAASRVTSVRSSSSPCAASIRSNGSRCFAW